MNKDFWTGLIAAVIFCTSLAWGYSSVFGGGQITSEFTVREIQLIGDMSKLK